MNTRHATNLVMKTLLLPAEESPPGRETLAPQNQMKSAEPAALVEYKPF
jgi:hypothetical protein